jgi:polyisoprenoid-binding protein YceI
MTMRKVLAFLAILLVWAAAQPASAQQITARLRPAETRIEITLGATMHTVHGSFRLKSGVINYDAAAGTASGEIVVDAASGDTGNEGRDRKMHREVLESEKYPEIIFRPEKISGNLSARGASTLQMEGTFQLHGTGHPFSMTVQVQPATNSLTASTRFAIPYVEWGLKNPSTFLLHVSNKVDVVVTSVADVVPGGQYKGPDH